MDHKVWLWRKRSLENIIIANNKADISSKSNEEELRSSEKEALLETSVKILNEKLSSILRECNAKDEIIENYEKMVQEAVAGHKKAEEEALLLRKELDEALQQREAAHERLTPLNAALKEHMEQLSSVKKEQDQRVRDAVMKTSREFEKAHKKLEEKLTETIKKLATLTVENSQLTKALVLKDNLIEDLSKCKSELEAESNALMARLDSTEKENAFLKYEFHILEKELEIRNDELIVSRQSADASYKQNLQSMHKITKLEEQCQRLGVLLRKRLPGPVSSAKKRNEVEIPGKGQTETRRRKLNPVTGGIVLRNPTRSPPEILSKKITFLIEQLADVEEENKNLKELVAMKDDELHFSRDTSAQMASRLSEIEALLGNLSQGQKPKELAICGPISNELSLACGVDLCNKKEVACSESGDSVLISELEYFGRKEPKSTSECKSIGASDMSLMDDFVEMEKLAIVAFNSPYYGNHTSLDSLEKELCGDPREFTGKELVPVTGDYVGKVEQEFERRDALSGKPCDWIQEVLKVILEQNCVSKRNFNELLEDIRIALLCLNHPSTHEDGNSKHPNPSKPLSIDGYITWKSPCTSPRVGFMNGTPESGTSLQKTSNDHINSNMSRSIHKIIGLIDEVCSTCLKEHDIPDNLMIGVPGTILGRHFTTPADYLVQVFGWRSCELTTLLQELVYTCNNLLDGKVNFEKLCEEIAYALGWIVSNCIAFKGISEVEYNIKQLVDQDVSQNGNKIESRSSEPFSEADKVKRGENQPPNSPSNATLNSMFAMEKIQIDLQKENEGLKDDSFNRKFSIETLMARLQLANGRIEALKIQLRESEESNYCLKTDLETLKESKQMIEDQNENQKLINEDLDTQLTVAKAKLNEVLQKLSSLELELEDKSHCCEELETTCLELQLQLESKGTPSDNTDPEERQLNTGREIATVSAKLADCQETILNLRKQLKALASPNDVTDIDKVFSVTTTTTNKRLSHHTSLRDRMLAEEGAGGKDLQSPKSKEIIRSEETQMSLVPHPIHFNSLYTPKVHIATPEAYFGPNHKAKSTSVNSLAIVASKKSGGIGLLRKLLFRKKKGSSKKISVAFG